MFWKKSTNVSFVNTRWFKYDRDDLCVNKSQFVPVIFEPPCINYGILECVFFFCASPLEKGSCTEDCERHV
jgi:hypothetical protein